MNNLLFCFALLSLGFGLCADNSVPVTLTGNVVTPACTIESGSDGRTIYLGSWPAKMFASAGAASDAAAFTVTLSGCTGGVTRLTAKFAGDSAGAGNDLIRLDSEKQREQVAIELLDGSSKRVPLNTSFDASIPENSDGYTFNFKARFVSLGGLPGAGEATAHVLFSVAYQ